MRQPGAGHSAAGSTGQLEPICIDVIHGPDAPRTIVCRDHTTIGRDSHATVSLSDNAVSRSHATLHRMGEQIVIVDHGSRNGLYVDGERTTGTAVLEPGSLVRIGQTLLRISVRTDKLTRPGGVIPGHAMRAVVAEAKRLAANSGGVFVRGEAGTGKDLIARFIHSESETSAAFITVNCSALVGSNIERELFGPHGLWSSAKGGTLYFDEVAALPLKTQNQLAATLHDPSVRVILASAWDIAAEVARGTFSSELYVAAEARQLFLPKLADRIEDLPEVATSILDRFGEGYSIDSEAMEALALYEWPLNVRELEAVLRSAMAGTKLITLASLPRRFGLHTSSMPPGMPSRQKGESLRARLEGSLRAHHGNVRRAAKSLGLSRTHVYRLMTRWNIDPDSFRDPSMPDDDETLKFRESHPFADMVEEPSTPVVEG